MKSVSDALLCFLFPLLLLKTASHTGHDISDIPAFQTEALLSGQTCQTTQLLRSPSDLTIEDELFLLRNIFDFSTVPVFQFFQTDMGSSRDRAV